MEKVTHLRRKQQEKINKVECFFVTLHGNRGF